MTRFITIILLLLAARGMAQCGACSHQVDLVTNGDFTNGNTGFSSDLDFVTGIFTCPLCPENTYTIGPNAIFYHSGFSGSDHTNPPSGNFFIANGPGQSGSNVWCQSFNVEPNTDYVFTFWAQDITNNNDDHPTALLQASLNGVLSTDTLDADGDWEIFTMSWNSGDTTQLDICIVNQQSQTGGNDFGLDDISFTGCHSYQLSHLPFAGNDTSVCSNETIFLGEPSYAGYSFLWNNATGLSSTVVASPEFSLENISGSPITEIFILTTDSAGVGCVFSDTLEVTVQYVPSFTLGEDIMVCPGETTLLDAGDTWDSVEWDTGETTTSIIADPGEHYATIEYNDCFVTDYISVQEQNMPLVDLGEDQVICETSPLTLDAGITGEWSTGVTAAEIIVSETGNYSFTFTSGECSVMDEVYITVDEMPLIALSPDTAFCEAQVLTLEAGVSGLWNTGTTSSSITVSEPGYYDIVVENGECTAVAGTNVSIYLLPVAFLPEDTLICDSEYLSLDVEADQNEMYLWSTGDTTSSITVNSQDFYEVTVTNFCGTASDEVFVETTPCGWEIFIPNSLTPNEDGVNDVWFISGYNVTNLKIFIYNRLGDLIYYSTDMNEEWSPSEGVGDDVYNYRVEAISYENETIERLGHIYLLR